MVSPGIVGVFFPVQEVATILNHIYLIVLLAQTRHIWSSRVWFNLVTYADPRQQQQYIILFSRHNPRFVISYASLSSTTAFISSFLLPDSTVSSSHGSLSFWKLPLSP
jgi:hypothetical protein